MWWIMRWWDIHSMEKAFIKIIIFKITIIIYTRLTQAIKSNSN
jgi:hypothetical protein